MVILGHPSFLPTVFRSTRSRGSYPRKQGSQSRETAACLNISRQTVSKLWKQFQNDGAVGKEAWTRSEARMAQLASEDRYLALTARRNKKGYCSPPKFLELAAAAPGLTCITADSYTEGLTKKALLCQKAKGMCFAVFTEKRDRFNWCEEHQTWTRFHQWSHVLFTDESRFSLTGDSKRVYIWRESGTPK
ncbi:transposable element Tc1 transposase [Trichonephila clavipes]|nr:transposable element Tc1 transposase [Trichonephila clavipes]